MGNPPNNEYRKDYAGERVLTADGVEITEGLRVWTNNLEAGVISLENADFEWHGPEQRYVLWFRVIRDDMPNDRGHLQSDDRVATRHPFTGKAA